MLVAEPNKPRGMWPLGRIVSTHPGHDGMVRAVTVHTQYGEYKKTNHKTVFLRGSGDLGLETVNRFDSRRGNEPPLPFIFLIDINSRQRDKNMCFELFALRTVFAFDSRFLDTPLF